LGVKWLGESSIFEGVDYALDAKGVLVDTWYRCFDHLFWGYMVHTMANGKEGKAKV
jgi:hypothetical protein